MRRLWSPALLLLLLLAAPARAITITEFPVDPGAPALAHVPRYIHPGPDGNLWFGDGGTSPAVGRISTTGEHFASIPDAHRPVEIAVLPDQTVFWTSDQGCGFRQPSGMVQICSLPLPAYAATVDPSGNLHFTAQTLGMHEGVVCDGHDAASVVCHPESAIANTRYTGLALAADGHLWTAAYEQNHLHRVDAAGKAFDQDVEFPVPSGPSRLTLGPDGNLWVTMYDASAIDRVTPAGDRTRFFLPPGVGPNDITVGPDGALWFTELKAGAIGRMTTSGVLTNEFPIPTANSQPIGITTGPDGAIWFTESIPGKIGRLQLDPGAGSGGGVSDHLAPTFVKRPAFSPRRFRVGRANTPISARKAPRGSTLAYSLSEPATVTVAVARKAAGRKVGKSCRAPSRSKSHGKRCTRYVAVAKLKRRGLQGPNGLAFSGRVRRRALKPGAYRATVTAKDAAGNASKRSTASFKIVA